MSKARQNKHKILVSKQKYLSHLYKIDMKGGYKTKPRSRQIEKSAYNEFISWKRKHKMLYTYQKMCIGISKVGKVIAENFRKSIKAHGVKL